MTMTVKEVAFYEGGRKARCMKQPRETNPYGRFANPKFHAFWDAGWEDADREMTAQLRQAMDFGGCESDCAY